MRGNCRPIGRFFYWSLISVVLTITAQIGHAAKSTRVVDTIYRADGSVASGTLVLSWPAFTTARGEVIAAGRMSVKIGPNGSVDIPLVANTGSNPASFYTVVIKGNDGASTTEFWTVPDSTSSSVSAVRSKVVPASVAAQFVGRDYVDTAIANVSGSQDFVALNPTASQTVTQASGTSLQVNHADVANANGIRYADRYATIQSAIDDSGMSGAVVIPPEYSATDSFNNPKNRPVLDLRRLGDVRGGVLSVKDFGAKGASGYYPSNSIAAGSKTLTSANPAWIAQQISMGSPIYAGMRILIAGAGAGGADLDTTVVSYDNAGHFTVASAAATTVSNRGAWWGSDDTAAIQSAINYCHGAGGCTLEFPQGNYMVAGVTIPAVTGLQTGKILLKCAGGRQTTRLVGIGADQSAIVSVADAGHPTAVHGCGFESYDYNNRHSIAINIQGGIEHEIYDNYFGALYHAIKATSTFNNSIRFNRFYGSYDSCIKFVPGASAVIDTRIDDNEFGVCGGGHTHGWAVEQVSTGGGGSNWIQIRGNDCEGTEWNGCFYLYNVANPVVIGNRVEVDAKVGDGTFRVLSAIGISGGYFAKNEFSGHISLNGNNNTFTQNNYFADGSGIAFDVAGNGNLSIGETLVDSQVTGGLARIGNSSDTWISLRPYGTGHINIYNSTDTSNARKNFFMSMYSASGGGIVGWGNAPAFTWSRPIPAASTGATYSAGDRLYNSQYAYAPALPASRFAGWICASTTCSWNGSAWTGTWDFITSSQCLTVDGTAAPTSGTWNKCDFVRNTNASAGGMIGWRNVLAGTPGTWEAIAYFDPASPIAIGATTPGSATFATLSTTGVTTLGADATVDGKLTVNQQLPSMQGIVIKAATAPTPDQVTCAGSCSLAFWVKADALALADGQNVTSWSDSSSGGHNLTAGATPPVFATNVVNGKPVVRFTSSTSQMTSSAFSIAGPYSTFFVMKKPAGASGCFPLTDSGNESYYWSGATQLRVYNNGGSGGYPWFYIQPTVDDAKFHIYSSVMTSLGASYGYQDGLQLGTQSAAGLANWNGGVKVNDSSGSCNADLAEIVIYQGALGMSDRQKVEAYLVKKYGTAQKLLDLQNDSGTSIASIDGYGRISGAGVVEGFTAVAYTATPVFDASVANIFKITLTGNVTSSTLSNAAAGQSLTFVVCQDATGSRSMAWPANMTGGMTVGSIASKCSSQSFVFDGTNAIATSPGVANQ